MSRAFQIWFAIWFGGILAFILYPLCKADFNLKLIYLNNVVQEYFKNRMVYVMVEVPLRRMSFSAHKLSFSNMLTATAWMAVAAPAALDRLQLRLCLLRHNLRLL